MDFLADLIQSVGMHPAVLSENNIKGDWGFIIPASKSAGFHIVRRGKCWLNTKSLAHPICIESGDMVFISQGVEHSIVSKVGMTPLPLPKFIDQQISNAHSGKYINEPHTNLICGAYHFENNYIHPFFSELPDIIHFPSNDVKAHHPMHAALMLLSAELDQQGEQPGNSIIINRMIDVMFCYILRQWMETTNQEQCSQIHAFYDIHLRAPLTAMHKKVEHNWSVEELASKANLSRAAFAQRFKKYLNETPINYIIKLRIQKSMQLLQKTSLSIEKIAELVGYSTGFALSKAFKRISGISPQQYRLQQKKLS
ncbi:MAG: AraC family transcriptional regulator [Psychromonas sp.]|nr:AraC family transcriptional regulator [Alteromonadales bacterium]MCP5077070.1 AraC family transcriptional regulator [Psychromonas sp.]